MNQEYKTERLILKPIEENDAEFFFELVNSPQYKHFIADRKLDTVEKTKDFLLDRYINNTAGLTVCNFTVIEKSSGNKIGSTGLFKREELDAPDIGFSFLPNFQGKGFAFESAELVKSLAFEEFGFKEIQAITRKDNLSSQKLIERLGLTLIGTTKLGHDENELLLYNLKKA